MGRTHVYVVILCLISTVIIHVPVFVSGCVVLVPQINEPERARMSAYGVDGQRNSSIKDLKIPDSASQCENGFDLMRLENNQFIYGREDLYAIEKIGNEISFVNHGKIYVNPSFDKDGSVGMIEGTPGFLSTTSDLEKVEIEYGDKSILLNLEEYGTELYMDNLNAIATIGIGFASETLLISYVMTNSSHYQFVTLFNHIPSNTSELKYLPPKLSTMYFNIDKAYAIINFDIMITSLFLDEVYNQTFYDLNTLDTMELGLSSHLHQIFNSDYIIMGSQYITIAEYSEGIFSVSRYEFQTLEQIGEKFELEYQGGGVVLLEDYLILAEFEEAPINYVFYGLVIFLMLSIGYLTFKEILKEVRKNSALKKKQT